MPNGLSHDESERYRRDGFVLPIDILSPAQAADHRRRLERAEAEHGPMHYRVKPHLMLRSAAELSREPAILDAVEGILGPDILLWDSGYIVKEPGSKGYVSWHQDLTYWGLDSDLMVAVWLALSPANAESGCMKMVPGSHNQGQLAHKDTHAADNVLHRGQEVAEVDEATAVHASLAPGQASLHHGYVLHASTPNRSADRRIGLSMQFVAPLVRQLVDSHESATLVRGEDRYGHFRPEPDCIADFSPEAVAFQAEAERRKLAVYDSA